MTEPFHNRVAEIIAAYGGDSSRWPDAERETALHVAATSPELTALMAGARALDADLAGWARAPLATMDDAAGRGIAAVARIAMRPARSVARWATGAGLAASLVGLVFLTPARMPSPNASPAPSTPVAAEPAFAQVFTPTLDEEQVL